MHFQGRRSQPEDHIPLPQEQQPAVPANDNLTAKGAGISSGGKIEEQQQTQQQPQEDGSEEELAAKVAADAATALALLARAEARASGVAQRLGRSHDLVAGLQGHAAAGITARLPELQACTHPFFFLSFKHLPCVTGFLYTHMEPAALHQVMVFVRWREGANPRWLPKLALHKLYRAVCESQFGQNLLCTSRFMLHSNKRGNDRQLASFSNRGFLAHKHVVRACPCTFGCCNLAVC